MFFLLLLFTCAVAQDVKDEVAPYGNLRDSIQKSFQLLNDNVISMDLNIPYMNDSRRHYAEILCIAYVMATDESACSENDYYRDYQNTLNATNNLCFLQPQAVVDGTKWFVNEIKTNIGDMLKLVDSYGPTSSQENDKLIDEVVKKEKNDNFKLIYLATGIAAMELNKMHVDYFAPRSKNLSAHKFLITGVRKLKNFVMALHEFTKATTGFEC